MSTSSIISMVTILVFVVGGFIFFLNMAIQKENKKKTPNRPLVNPNH